MQLSSVLIANRGEIAIRIARSAGDSGLRRVVVHSEDDAGSAHRRFGEQAVALRGSGADAYLDIAQLIAVGITTGVDAIHPGYGFLSERPEFAEACSAAGFIFVGPSPETLRLFGDKAAARRAATEGGVRVLPGTETRVSDAGAAEFLRSLDGGSAMVKAVSGGGGRGMRVARTADELGPALERCRSEALAAFGSDEVYLEAHLPEARHVEVQIAGDQTGVVRALGDRECSLQRRHQKLIEFGPAPWLDREIRAELHAAAVRVGEVGGLVGIATVEFLVPSAPTGPALGPVFLEVNPRLQVEHTVTEAVTGIDLVALQFALAEGRPLGQLLAPSLEPRGQAIQLRVCAEQYDKLGAPEPRSGTITAIRLPSGPGVRVDTAAEVGYASNPRFDSLVAKVIVHSPLPDTESALRKARRVLGELVIEGLETNVAALARILALSEVGAGPVDTGFLERHPELWATSGLELPFVAAPASDHPVLATGELVLRSPVLGTVVGREIPIGQAVGPLDAVVVIESMKMEHVVAAPGNATVVQVMVGSGTTVQIGQPVAVVRLDGRTVDAHTEDRIDLDEPRADLAEVVERHAIGLDAARPEAVARRHSSGHRTARENISALVDEGTFVEYAPLVVAAQRRRRSLEELISRTPSDGLVGGIGRINGALFGDDAGRCVVATYDYTVLAGTQGLQNHRKKDRLFELAERMRLPVVLFAEGGGGRPGDTDGIGGSGLDCLAFNLFGRLSGLVPLVGITSGYCFAGNAALLGTCDVIIATDGSNIGMGGPAMIEGGGLGVFDPREIGPVETQFRNGVVDLVVPDEAAAVTAAQQYLAYFQGALEEWTCTDQRELRRLIPENRLRVYDVRRVVRSMFDEGSVMELRQGFGTGMVTALARVEGRSVGVIANDPQHLGGAIDAEAADKATHFMQLCDAHGLPLVFLCDTPGFMVGPAAEEQALVRKAARLFAISASLSVPFMTIVLRKGYGLGAQAMAGGSFRAPLFTIAWPTGEFGGMGLEGAVKLGFRNELEAIEDPVERQATYEVMVARMYEHGKALSTASTFEIDDVIDPAESRRWITSLLAAAPARRSITTKPRPCVDPW